MNFSNMPNTTHNNYPVSNHLYLENTTINHPIQYYHQSMIFFLLALTNENLIIKTVLFYFIYLVNPFYFPHNS